MVLFILLWGYPALASEFVPLEVASSECVAPLLTGVGKLLQYSGPGVPAPINRKRKIQVSEGCVAMVQTEAKSREALTKDSTFEITSVKRRELKLSPQKRVEEIHFQLANNRVISEVVCRPGSARAVRASSSKAKPTRPRFQCYTFDELKKEPFQIGLIAANPSIIQPKILRAEPSEKKTPDVVVLPSTPGALKKMSEKKPLRKKGEKKTAKKPVRPKVIRVSPEEKARFLAESAAARVSKNEGRPLVPSSSRGPSAGIEPSPSEVRRVPLAPPLIEFIPPAASGEDFVESLQDAAQEVARAAQTVSNRKTALSVQDERLVHTFQNNFLSLISHELRTPLMGVQNSLSLLEQEVALHPAQEMKPFQEWVGTARRNTNRLSRTLQSLMDLASMESDHFHIRLREMSLSRFSRSLEKPLSLALAEKQSSLRLVLGADAGVLGDPQKLGRAAELLAHVISTRVQPGTNVELHAGPFHLIWKWTCSESGRNALREAWSAAQVAFESGTFVGFQEAEQSESDFLTREEEGLGHELTLALQIARLHDGKFLFAMDANGQVEMNLSLPVLDSETQLLKVLVSRLHEYAPENGALGAVALVLLVPPSGMKLDEAEGRVKTQVFRASDAVFQLKTRGQIAVILNDCRAVDLPAFVKRMEKTLGGSIGAGWVAAPEDGIDPPVLMELALKRLRD